MKPTIIVLAFLLFLVSCQLTEKSMAGTYRLSPDSQTRLTLHSDKTFEFVKNFNSPGPVFFPDSTELNFRTIGKWQLVEKKLVLNSDNITNETFTLQAKDRETKGRAGKIKTDHGEIETPIFIPVGTVG